MKCHIFCWDVESPTGQTCQLGVCENTSLVVLVFVKLNYLGQNTTKDNKATNLNKMCLSSHLLNFCCCWLVCWPESNNSRARLAHRLPPDVLFSGHTIWGSPPEEGRLYLIHFCPGKMGWNQWPGASLKKDLRMNLLVLASWNGLKWGLWVLSEFLQKSCKWSCSTCESKIALRTLCKFSLASTALAKGNLPMVPIPLASHCSKNWPQVGDTFPKDLFVSCLDCH